MEPEEEALRVDFRREGNEIRIASPSRFAEDEAELVFADAEGRFAASWCNGRLGFASLVLPQTDGKGALLEKWTIPMFDLSGKEIAGAERDSCKRFLSGSWYLPEGQNELALDYHSSRYPLTYVVAMLLVEEAGREWTADRFLCADAGSRFESQSSHRFRCGDAIVGEAEMFTWHRAKMRLAWDLHASGDLESGAIPLEVGADYRRGGFHFELVGIEQGEFRRKGEAGKDKLGDPTIYARVEEGTVARTAFFAGTVSGRSIRRIEGRAAGDGSWQELPFVAEDDGLVAVDLPEEGIVSELQVVWAPRTLRVVVDVPGIGGGLPENEGIATYNEVAFRLHQSQINNPGIGARLWQLLGRFPQFESRRYDPDRKYDRPIDPMKLYRADDLLAIWREMNPELRIEWEEEFGGFVLRDR
ncbi:MAG TPA: hypothetical protein PLA50_10220 [Bacteroidia bacterium]|nr:hypothetical protein [Bacteroidia bacterium]